MSYKFSIKHQGTLSSIAIKNFFNKTSTFNIHSHLTEIDTSKTLNIRHPNVSHQQKLD